MVGRYAGLVSGPSPIRTHSRTKLLGKDGDVLAVAHDVVPVDASAVVAGTAVDDVALAVVRDHVVGAAARVDDVAAGPREDEVSPAPVRMTSLPPPPYTVSTYEPARIVSFPHCP